MVDIINANIVIFQEKATALLDILTFY